MGPVSLHLRVRPSHLSSRPAPSPPQVWFCPVSIPSPPPPPREILLLPPIKLSFHCLKSRCSCSTFHLDEGFCFTGDTGERGLSRISYNSPCLSPSGHLLRTLSDLSCEHPQGFHRKPENWGRCPKVGGLHAAQKASLGLCQCNSLLFDCTCPGDGVPRSPPPRRSGASCLLLDLSSSIHLKTKS